MYLGRIIEWIKPVFVAKTILTEMGEGVWGKGRGM